MNEKWITFHIDERKFITKLVPNTKFNNNIHYYTINESKNIIDFTLIEDDTTKAIEGNDKGYLIIVKSEKNEILSDSKIK